MVGLSETASLTETADSINSLTHSTICLSMIVKNEASVIERCLESVRPLVDHWIIVDTGSTDGTQDVIRRAMADIPGTLHERPWVDFASNRSEALALSRDKAEYSLIIDADDALEHKPGYKFGRLTQDGYMIRIADTATAYSRLQLVSNARPWRYVGVLHEFLACEGDTSQATLEGVTMRRNHDGARRRDPDTYRRDAALLERALRTEPDGGMRTRYVFYLAQSYRDCGDRERALLNYLKRAELGHWDQEVYVSLYEAARLQDALGRPEEEVIATYRRAINLNPTRAEAYHGAAHYLRLRSKFAEGFEIAQPGLHLRPPAGALFVNEWIYDFGLPDEYAVCAYWAGHYQECIDACTRLLATGSFDEGTKHRIEANLGAARSQLPPPPTLPAPEPNLPVYPVSTWQPDRAQGGTELMRDGLLARLGPALAAIELQVNFFDRAALTGKPLVLWMHHNIDQSWVQWCHDATLVADVTRFVFVSHWQRERYLRTFDLPPEKCVVLRNAIPIADEMRAWPQRSPRKVAYTSTPFRGLSVLLDAWEQLQPRNAELHVWSSWKLYGAHHDEHGEAGLIERTKTTRGVHYRGLLPNAELRAELRDIDILAYPSVFAETSCLSVIEAMAAGCRVVCAAHGALPETTAGFARLYAAPADPARHAALFANLLRMELADPWRGEGHLAWEQQIYARTMYGWSARVRDWERLLADLTP